MSIQTEIPAVEANASLVEPEDQKQLVQVVQQNNLHADTALSLQSSFAPFFKEARDVIAQSRNIVVTDASQKLQIALAGDCRRALKAIRVKADKTRKDLKDESLRRGNAIQGFYNILLHLTESEEQRLEEQEKFAEIREQKRKEGLRVAREAIVAPLGIDPALYQLGVMSEETFTQLVEGTKLARAADAERRRKEEAERIEREAKEQAERERIRLENERLKREAAEQEAALAAERARVAKEKEAAEAKARLEREMAEKELKRLADEKAAAELKAKQEREAAAAETARQLAEQKRIADEAAAKERVREAETLRIANENARKEREESERKLADMKKAAHDLRIKEQSAREENERKVKAQREADELRQRQEAEAARKAAAAPDKDRLLTYANAIRALEIPTFNTPEAKAIATTIAASRDRFAEWCEQKAFAL